MRILVLLAIAALAGCASQPDPRPAALPAFVIDALQAPTAQRAKLYVGADGTLSKVVAYVDAAAIPDWVHTIADEQLGAGENREFEIEQYADGTRTYEVTRTIDGRKAELSVSVDKVVRYVERELAPEAIPAAVKQTIDGMAGVELVRVEHKKGPEIEVFDVVATRSGKEIRFELDAAGAVKTRARRIPAVLQIEQR